MKVPKWTKDEVLRKFEDVDFLFSAVETIYDRQREDEIEIGRASAKDGRGFTPSDSVFFDAFVKAIEGATFEDYDSIRFLEVNLKDARRRMKKYCGQVAKALDEDFVERYGKR